MKGFFVDGEPFSRSHRARAWNLVSGWILILHLLFYDDNTYPRFLIFEQRRISPKLTVIRQRANELIDLHFQKIKGRLIYSPDALAAAALYLACVEQGMRKVTQRLISCLAGRTEVWVRNNYKKLWKELKLRDTGRDLFEAG